MNLAISMQSLKNVFRFPFHDPRWKIKVLIGSALAFAGVILPIIPALPLMGYFARMMRAGARNEDAAVLPEWNDWGELFLDGLRQAGVLIVAFLPATVLSIVGWFVYMVGIMAMPVIDRDSSFLGVFTMMGAFGFFFITMAISMILLVIAAMIFPAAMAHVAFTRSFVSFFRVGEWWKIMRKNFLGFQVAIGIFGSLYVLLMVVTQILYFTVVLCLVIPFLLVPLGFYSGLVFYRLVGQAYGETIAPAEEAALPEPEVEPSPAI